MVQCLRIHTPNAGDPGAIPGQGTGSQMLQLRVHMPQLKILCAPTKTWCSQINTQIKKFKYMNKKYEEWKGFFLKGEDGIVLS